MLVFVVLYLVLILHSYSYFFSLEFVAIVLTLWDSLRQPR